MIWCFSKLRDSRTSAIEFQGLTDFNQGIFIDIYPLDDTPDGKNFSLSILDIQRDFLSLILVPELILKHLEQGKKFSLSLDLISVLLKLSKRERFQQFEDFNKAQFGPEHVNNIVSEIFFYSKSRRREWSSDTIDLPFEYLTVPAPIAYEQILKRQYGNYHIPKINGSTHEGTFFNPDTPYTYYEAHPEKLPQQPANIL